MTEVCLSGKGTLSICGVTQFKDLRSTNISVKQGFGLEVLFEHNWSDFNKKLTVSSSEEPGPYVHHHSCHDRKPICATVSLLTSPRAPLSEGPEPRENLKIKNSSGPSTKPWGTPFATGRKEKNNHQIVHIDFYWISYSETNSQPVQISQYYGVCWTEWHGR